MTQQTMENPQQEKKGGCTFGGCLLWGCVTSVILGLLGALFMFVVVNKVVDTAMGFLDDQPAEFTLPDPTEEELVSAKEKGEGLSSAVEEGSGGRFALSEGELNALIAEGLKQSNMKGFKARVQIADGKISGEISLPVEEILPQIKDKYLNGEATFEIRKTSAKDRLQVNVVDLKVKGETVPDEILNEIKAVNMVDEIYVNPQNREAKDILDSIETIEVDGDRIVFEVVEKSGETSEPAEEEAPEPAP